MNQSVMEHAKRFSDRATETSTFRRRLKKPAGQTGKEYGGLDGLVVTGDSALAPTYTDFPIGGIRLSAVGSGASGEVIKTAL